MCGCQCCCLNHTQRAEGTIIIYLRYMHACYMYNLSSEMQMLMSVFLQERTPVRDNVLLVIIRPTLKCLPCIVSLIFCVMLEEALVQYESGIKQTVKTVDAVHGYNQNGKPRSSACTYGTSSFKAYPSTPTIKPDDIAK